MQAADSNNEHVNTRRLSRGTVALGLAALMATGCSPAPDPSASSSSGFAESALRAITMAEHGGADQAQLATLREAQESGVLAFEPYKAAIDATFQCFRERGVVYESLGTDTSLGYPQVSYRVEGDASGPTGDAQACESEHSAFVAELYQTQPMATEASDRRFLEAQPLLIACLEEAGFLSIEDPSPDQVRDAIWAGFDAAEAGTAPSGFDPTACLAEAGITAGSF